MQWQGSFSQAEYAGKKKQTRRDKFLAEMDKVVPPAFQRVKDFGATAVCGVWWPAVTDGNGDARR